MTQRENARLCLEAIEEFQAKGCDNTLRPLRFFDAPRKQPQLVVEGVAVSVRCDLFARSSFRGQEFRGGAIFRMTKAEDESEGAAADRREMGAYVATLVQMQRSLDDSDPTPVSPKLCLSVDVRQGEVIEAPKATKQRIKNLEAACASFSAMWAQL